MTGDSAEPTYSIFHTAGQEITSDSYFDKFFFSWDLNFFLVVRHMSMSYVMTNLLSWIKLYLHL